MVQSESNNVSNEPAPRAITSRELDEKHIKRWQKAIRRVAAYAIAKEEEPHLTRASALFVQLNQKTVIDDVRRVIEAIGYGHVLDDPESTPTTRLERLIDDASTRLDEDQQKQQAQLLQAPTHPDIR